MNYGAKFGKELNLYNYCNFDSQLQLTFSLNADIRDHGSNQPSFSYPYEPRAMPSKFNHGNFRASLLGVINSTLAPHCLYKKREMLRFS